MRATIRDVAKKSGVSISTVSKVFNGYTDVNEATRKKIFKIAKELDYTPNMAARLLSSKKQQTIALILNELIFTRKSTMPMEVLSGVYKYTDGTNFEFVFYGTTTEKQKEKTFAQFCHEHNITGAVVQGLKLTDPYFEEIKATNIPTVLIDIIVDNDQVGTVSIDNTLAAREAVDYLIEKGHQQIALINGSRDASVSQSRELGYLESLRTHQLPVNEAYIQYANFDEDIAFFITKNLLEQQTDITALFCASDVMAIGAMRAVQMMNKKVPEDIAVIGFDDVILASYVTPSLSTVSQDMEKIGFAAAELLGEMINGHPTNLRRIVPHELIEREST